MKKIKRNFELLLLSAGLLIASGSFAQTKKAAVSGSTEVSFPAAGALQDEETPLNTVTTTGPDGARYKLVQIGDRLPKFYVNCKLIATKDLDNYQTLIGKLMPVLWERQKAAANAKHIKTNNQQDKP